MSQSYNKVGDVYGYAASFGFPTLHGRLFYFYKKDGKINTSSNGKEIPLDREVILQYGYCSAGELNPRLIQNSVAFAWRGTQWYYVEPGIFDQ